MQRQDIGAGLFLNPRGREGCRYREGHYCVPVQVTGRIMIPGGVTRCDQVRPGASMGIQGSPCLKKKGLQNTAAALIGKRSKAFRAVRIPHRPPVTVHGRSFQRFPNSFPRPRCKPNKRMLGFEFWCRVGDLQLTGYCRPHPVVDQPDLHNIVCWPLTLLSTVRSRYQLTAVAPIK